MKRVLANYRPISVLTFFSKVFEKAISKYPLAFHDSITIHYVNFNSVFKKNTQPAMRFVSIVERISTALSASKYATGVFSTTEKPMTRQSLHVYI